MNKKGHHPLAVAVAAVGIAAFSSVAFAQQAPNPDAGTLIKGVGEDKPVAPPRVPEVEVEKPKVEKPQASPGAKIQINGFRVTGTTVFSEADLIPLLDGKKGQELDFDELQSVSDIVANHYKRHGYFLAYAYLPAQEVKDGIVTIAVMEGRVGEVRIRMDENAKVSEDTVRRFIDANIKPGDLITDRTLEYGLLLLNDLPGVTIKSTLTPGSAPGTADVVVAVGEGRRFSGQVELDNFGQTTTGVWRYGGSANVNSPFGVGDQFSVRVLETDKNRLSYTRLGYTLPVGGYGTRLGIANTNMDYSLGTEKFLALRMHGIAKISNIYALHPLYRTRNLNVFAQASYDDKKLRDYTDSTDSKNFKGVRNYVVSLFGDGRDSVLGGGMNTWSLGYTDGQLNLETAAVKAIDQGRNGLKTHGAFTKTNLQLSRLQNVATDVALYVAYSQQWASKNLDTAEKMSLGGATGVRAYPQGEASVDEGYVATAELRFNLGNLGFSELPGQVGFSAFVDSGRGRTDKTPLATNTANWQGRSGAGFGLTWGQPDDFLVRLSTAWRLSNQGATADVNRTPRVLLNATKWF